MRTSSWAVSASSLSSSRRQSQRVLDTDPIDVVASNNKVSVLRYAVPYQDELILFSAQYQFRFNAAETVLTPKTAQITVLTQFEVDVKRQTPAGWRRHCLLPGKRRLVAVPRI